MFLLAPVFVSYLSHCQPSHPQPGTAANPPASSPTTNKATFGSWGIETQCISKSVNPGDDFFSYVNEGWVKTTKIPDGYWDYGQTSVLGAQTDDRIRDIIQSAARRAASGQLASTDKEERIIGDLYASFMDTERIDRLGLAPIQKELQAILAARTYSDIARWMASPASSSIVAINVFPDAGNTKRSLVHLDQNNLTQPILGLPRREYYERTDGSYPEDRAAYQDYMEKTFERAGIDRAKERAADVLRLESKLAALQWNFEQLRDRTANYHLLTVQELAQYAPAFPWKDFLAARQVRNVKEVVLGTDTAVQAQARVFGETPVDQWVSYLAFHWIQNQIDLLPAAFRTASFDFYQRRLSGAKSALARDQEAVRSVNSRVPHAVGKLYVSRYYSGETSTKAQELFAYLRRAFAERLSQVTWMDDTTRRAALAKLAALRIKVGFPRKWRDYSGAAIRPDDLLGNVRRLQEENWKYQRSFLTGRMNWDENWYQSPQTVDASFSVLLNAVEIPAAILQPPFFDPFADPAVNFGSIGAIIGHEIGHGYDDQGAKYDGAGRIRNWWTETARKEFESRTGALVTQYDGYSPIEGLHLNGKRSLGENLGDLTGVSLAYQAYQLFLKDHPAASGIVRDGFSGDQRFFLAWGQTWRYVAPESAIRYIIENGYHSPAPYRVNGVVRNLDAWYTAFGVTPNEKLYLPPDQRVRLW